MSYRVPNKYLDHYYVVVSEDWKLLRAYRNYNYANEWRNNNLDGRGYVVHFTKYISYLSRRSYSPIFSVKHKMKYDKSDCFIFNTNEEEIKSLLNLEYIKDSEIGYWKFDSRIKQLHPTEKYPIDFCILDYKKDNIIGTDSVFLFQFSVDEQGIPFYTITEYPTMKSDGEKLTKMMSRELFNFISQE